MLTRAEIRALLKDVKQPYYDFEIAKICKWLRTNGLPMHASLKGEVVFRDKYTKEIVKL
jgi:hypothetical protein